MAQPGKLIVISGPSGAGKTTVIRRAMSECDLPFPLELSVSATTRPPREGEINGKNYHFLSHEEFLRRKEAGEFLECFEVFGSGYWYGTLRDVVTTGLNQGKWIILEIDVQGAAAVMEMYDDPISIFIRTESLAELEQRLRGRGTESEAAVQGRMATARNEWERAKSYQHQVINNDLDDSVRQVCQILKDNFNRL